MRIKRKYQKKEKIKFERKSKIKEEKDTQDNEENKTNKNGEFENADSNEQNNDMLERDSEKVLHKNMIYKFIRSLKTNIHLEYYSKANHENNDVQDQSSDNHTREIDDENKENSS